MRRSGVLIVGVNGDGRCVVFACDGDVDDLRNGGAIAIVDLDGEGLCDGLILSEVVDGGIVNGVSPFDASCGAIRCWSVYVGRESAEGGLPSAELSGG